jgi:hypothetical protein
MRSGGPRPTITAPALDVRRLPKAGGARVEAFCRAFLYVPKGKGARKRLRLRPWQVDIVEGLFDEPRPGRGLVSIPRGNGKSTLAAALGLYGLLADGVEGAQVLCVASDARQAGIVFGIARRGHPSSICVQNCVQPPARPTSWAVSRTNRGLASARRSVSRVLSLHAPRRTEGMAIHL